MYRKHALVISVLFSALFCVPFFSPAYVSAQTINQTYQETIDKLLQAQKDSISNPTEIQKSSVGAYLDVTTVPEIPGPNVPVTITIESYLTDLYKANISWSVDGKVLLRGTGKTIFSFQNGPSGKTTKVSLSIITNTGELVTKEFSFNPVGVTVLWEADTYTPPFYKGKAMMVPQANVRVIAIPDILGSSNALGAGEMVYTWTKDTYVDANKSGYGKNVYSFAGPKPLTNTKISLNVSSLDDSAQSEMQIYLPQTRPFILFYEKDPLLGVLYNKPLDSEISLSGKEVSVSASPYFFSNEREINQSHKYIWSVNNSVAKNYGRDITLRNDNGVKGSSVLSLSMRGVVQNYQTAEKKLQINFAEGGSSSRPIF